MFSTTDLPVLPVRQINGCRQFGPRESVKDLIPPRGSEVFVARIPKDFPHKELIRICSTPEKVYDIRLMLTFTKTNKGYAFVRYLNPEMALRATTFLNGLRLPGRYNGQRLVAMLSSDHRTLMLSGCSPSIKIEEVEQFFREINGTELVSVKEETQKGHASPVFYLLFATHRGAALMKKTDLSEVIPPHWGRWVHLYWQPNNEVDQRRRFKIERKRYLDSKQSNPTTRFPNPLANYEGLISNPSSSNIGVQGLPMLDEASNAASFDFSDITPFLGTESKQNQQMTWKSCPNQETSHAWGGALFGRQSENPGGRQYLRTIENSFPRQHELTGAFDETPLVRHQDTTESKYPRMMVDLPPIQHEPEGAWGGAPLVHQDVQTETRRKENLSPNQHELSFAWGGGPLVPQCDQTGISKNLLMIRKPENNLRNLWGEAPLVPQRDQIESKYPRMMVDLPPIQHEPEGAWGGAPLVHQDVQTGISENLLTIRKPENNPRNLWGEAPLEPQRDQIGSSNNVQMMEYHMWDRAPFVQHDQTEFGKNRLTMEKHTDERASIWGEGSFVRQHDQIEFGKNLQTMEKPMDEWAGAWGGGSHVRQHDQTGNLPMQWMCQESNEQNSLPQPEPIDVDGFPFLSNQVDQKDESSRAQDIMSLPPWARPIRGRGNNDQQGPKTMRF